MKAIKESLLGGSEETMWARNIVNALDWRKLYTQESMWADISNHYAHQYTDNRPHFNLVYIMAQTLIPSLAYQSPGVINTPTQPNMVQWASMWDSIDNWFVEQCEMHAVLKSAVLSSYLTNAGIAFIGYDFDDLSKGLRNIEGSPNRTRRTNAPWLDVVPAHRVVFAPGTTSLRNCPWVAKFVSVKTSSLKKIKGLTNVKASSIPDDILTHEALTWDHREKESYTFFWQIHDAESGKWCWLSTNGRYIMGWEDDPYQVDGLPCEVLSLNKNDKSIWGTCDPIYIMSQHIEGDDTRWQNLKQVRTSVPKFLYDSTILDEVDVRRLVSADTPGAIPVNLMGDKKMSDVIMQLNQPVNYGLMEYMKFLLNDAQLILGTGPNQMGTFAPGRRSATEAGIVEGVSTSRVGHRRASVGKFAEGLIRKANKLCAKNWNQPIVQQVLGADGALYWVQADPRALEDSGFGITTGVNIESLAPVSRERRKREAAELLGMLSQMQDAGVNTMPILKQFLTQFEWVDVRNVLPQVDGTMGMDQFMNQQQGMMAQGGMGPRAVQNLQGVNSLVQKLPTEQTTNMETANAEQNPEG